MLRIWSNNQCLILWLNIQIALISMLKVCSSSFWVSEHVSGIHQLAVEVANKRNSWEQLDAVRLSWKSVITSKIKHNITADDKKSSRNAVVYFLSFRSRLIVVFILRRLKQRAYHSCSTAECSQRKICRSAFTSVINSLRLSRLELRFIGARCESEILSEKRCDV